MSIKFIKHTNDYNNEEFIVMNDLKGSIISKSIKKNSKNNNDFSINNDNQQEEKPELDLNKSFHELIEGRITVEGDVDEINEVTELRLSKEETSIIRNNSEGRWYNKEDYWPIWIGMIWYIIMIISTFYGLNTAKIHEWDSWTTLKHSFSYYNIGGLLLIISGIVISMYFLHICLKKKEMLWQYLILNLIVILVKIIGSITSLKSIGIGDSIWAIVFGIIFRTFFSNIYIKYFKNTMSLEFFIKVSIVLLTINVKQILKVGPMGIIVSWGETIVLIILFYFIGKHLLKMSSDESILTSCGFSVCGSSAALAIVSSIKCEKKPCEALIVFMSLYTIPFIPIIPYIGKKFEYNPNIIGSWIGGSVDSTGAVFASAALGGVEISQTAIIIKMLQNVLIGPICLVIVSIWFRTFNPKILWDKFPKFLIGFILTCLITSLLPSEEGEHLVSNCFVISEWFGCISFIQIGLDIEVFRLLDMIKEYRKILILYIIGQTVDTFTTLGVSLLVF